MRCMPSIHCCLIVLVEISDFFSACICLQGEKPYMLDYYGRKAMLLLRDLEKVTACKAVHVAAALRRAGQGGGCWPPRSMQACND